MPALRRRSQLNKVVALNNAIFLMGNSLPHALTFEMYEANVRDNLYKATGSYSSTISNNMNHLSACKCDICSTNKNEIELPELTPEENKDCIDVESHIANVTVSLNQNSINPIQNCENNEKSAEFGSNSSLEELVNFYTLKLQEKSNNTERVGKWDATSADTELMESPLWGDDFDTGNIDMSLSATSTPKRHYISSSSLSSDDSFVDSLNNYELLDPVDNEKYSSKKIRILVGLIGKCKLIDCSFDVNDGMQDSPQI